MQLIYNVKCSHFAKQNEQMPAFADGVVPVSFLFIIKLDVFLFKRFFAKRRIFLHLQHILQCISHYVHFQLQ